MGLAAGQARLLTITGRKSDCEFESMRLSHQKIALARELADLSNEYQNSLTKTKLFYDYYGTGDLSNQLSYGILMQPSALNNYMPTILTDSMGRVALNGKLAQAAALAGIPQEGLGTLPSDEMRNRFIQSLATAGVITPTLSETIQGLPYNQNAGLGGGATVATMTEKITLKDFADRLQEYAVSPTNTYSVDGELTEALLIYDVGEYIKNGNMIYTGNVTSSDDSDNIGDFGGSNTLDKTAFTLGDILSGNYALLAIGEAHTSGRIGKAGAAIDAVVNSEFWDVMMDSMEECLDIGDSYTQAALAYARREIEYLISNQCNTEGKADPGKSESSKNQYWNDTDMGNFAYRNGDRKESRNTITSRSLEADKEYIGLVGYNDTDSGDDDKNGSKAHPIISVNLSTMMKAYLTYFTDFMNGVSATDAYGIQKYDVNKQIKTSHLVDDDTLFTVKIGSDISSDDLGQATFYDALFNQICLNGWTENNNLNDNEYLQQMLQNGMLYISKLKDDGYYYQGNYSTDSYIKEVADETLIAAAEAKYNTEKAKLNAKEETIDLKMKNLDTEISALTTEYDTVKNTISKQIEKCFKRYNA